MSSTYSSTEVNGFGESPPVNGDRRTIPFDYAFRYEKLEGVRNTVHNRTVTVSIESTFTAVSIGYGVIPQVSVIKFGLLPQRLLPPLPGILFSVASPPVSVFNNAFGSFGFAIEALAEALGERFFTASGRIGPLTTAVLTNGIKLNPAFAEQLLLGAATGTFDRRVFAETFQAVAAPVDQIEFLYAIFDEGSGREFQSEPILNIAGLGASDGGRPFRYFAQPIHFAPQSTIRMQVTEISEFAGELHVSLQGYKTLGAPGTPTGPRQVRRTGRIRR